VRCNVPYCELILVLLLSAVPGCSWRWWTPPPAAIQAPQVFYGQPTLEQVVGQLNANTARVAYLASDSASVSVGGGMLPPLRASLSLQPPARLRFRAETPLTGTEMDLGSNDELFWIWIRRNRPSAVYFARHDQFQNSQLGQILPIQPQWLSETLGLIRLVPTDQIEGPYSRASGLMELRIRDTTGQGSTKIVVLDGTYGWLRELHTYDGQGRLLASAMASKHRYYPLGAPDQGISLPHHIDVQLPTAQLSFQLDVDLYSINPPYGANPQLWLMPQIEGSPPINVAATGGSSPGQAGIAPPPHRLPPYDQSASGIHYRGYSRR
jgi:hypothetical protein